METYTIAMIVVGVIFLAIIIYVGYKYLKEKTLDDIREDVYQLFLKAEQQFNSDEGQKKFNWVVDKVRGLLPGWLNKILSDDALDKLVQFWFDGIKDLLDDGKLNGSTKEDSQEEAEKDDEDSQEEIEKNDEDNEDEENGAE